MCSSDLCVLLSIAAAFLPLVVATRIVYLGAFATLALEISFPLLVWSRSWRWLMIAGAVLLHTGISLTMGLATFGLLMLTMLLAFIPPAEVHALLRTLAGWRDHALALVRPPAVAPEARAKRGLDL